MSKLTRSHGFMIRALRTFASSGVAVFLTLNTVISDMLEILTPPSSMTGLTIKAAVSLVVFYMGARYFLIGLHEVREITIKGSKSGIHIAMGLGLIVVGTVLGLVPLQI